MSGQWEGDPISKPDDGWLDMPHHHSPYAGTATITRPVLRTFVVERVDPENPGWREVTKVTAHLVFNNKNRGEGLVFRRYYNDSVRTELVAEFEPGYYAAYYEESNG